MKGHSGSRKLTVMTVLFGIAALAMRRALYTTAVDVKGLLVRNQPLEIALTVLTLGVLIRIALAVRKKDGDVCETHPSANLPAALGSVAAAAGILVTVYTGGNPMSSPLENAWYVLGLAAAPCLLLAGVVVICFSSALYMTADLGVSTYDAVAIVMAGKWKVAKFKYCRIMTDLVCVLTGCVLFLLGGGALREIPTLAGIGTIITAFFMGPLIEFFNVTVARPLLKQK